MSGNSNKILFKLFKIAMSKMNIGEIVKLFKIIGYIK